ncbi:MAG: T9SS type A sorting domain-containing protein, partial [Bacteroidia bacterium]|nr:T9SS type A sorting domain-containing protein [Bacteroidia bacterium]
GYDSTMTIFGGGDNYAIDARGNNLAILLGGLGEHVVLWKSANNGTSFVKTLVDSFEYAPDYTVAAPVGYDSIPTNDGSLSVVLDANGKAHVAYAYSEVGIDATGASVFRPGSIGLVYWNEITQTQVDIPVNLAAVDVDLNGTFDLGTLVTDAAACRYRNASVLTMPTISVDASGAIFIIFSLPADADVSTDDQSFRDIWGVASYDGGTTWTEVMNLTNTGGIEEAFPTMARDIDGFLHIEYMEDAEPGTALNNGDADGGNNIGYLKVDKFLFQVGIKDQNKPDFVVGQNFPNPFNGHTFFGVSLSKAGKVSLSVSNMIGQKLMETNAGTLNQGMHNLSLDCSSLSAGVYFYTVNVDGKSVTKKMIIQ